MSIFWFPLVCRKLLYKILIFKGAPCMVQFKKSAPLRPQARSRAAASLYRLSKSGNSGVWNQICMKVYIHMTRRRPVKRISRYSPKTHILLGIMLIFQFVSCLCLHVEPGEVQSKIVWKSVKYQKIVFGPRKVISAKMFAFYLKLILLAIYWSRISIFIQSL